MTNKHEILEPESTYHIYNRANGSEKLFLSDDNYNYFIKKYQEYISPVADTFCYCLMPNHFHFLIRIKPEKEIINFFERKRRDLQGSKNQNLQSSAKQNLQGFKNLEGFSQENFEDLSQEKLEGLRPEELENLLSNQFSNFFNAYSKAFNKMYNRKGSLFMHTFKRKRVTDSIYLQRLIYYIHYNPLESHLVKKLNQWEYSSYNYIIREKDSFLKSKEVIEWFEDKENFIHFHSQTQEQSIEP